MKHFAIAALVLLVACGGGKGGDVAGSASPKWTPSFSPAPRPTEQGNSSPAERHFWGIARGAYQTSWQVCKSFTPEQTNRELNLGAGDNMVAIAQAYAEDGWIPEAQQGAFEGCLDAWLGNPNSP